MREKIIARLDSSALSRVFCRFLDSYWYPVLLSFSVLMGFIMGWDLVSMMVMAVVGCFVLVLGHDLRHVVLPTLIAVFQMSAKHSPFHISDYYTWSDYFTRGAPFWAIVIALIIISVLFIFHCWLRGTLVKIFTKPTRLLYWSVPLALALLLNGAGADGYTVRNLFFGVGTVILWLVIYVIYYHGIEHSEDATRCTLRYLMAALVVLLAELVWVYVSMWDAIFAPAGIQKDIVFFGWGIHNNMGCMLAMLIPVCFLMASRARVGWLYWILGVVTYVGVILTYSRSSLLAGAVVLLASMVTVCFTGRHKKLYRILLLSTLGGGILVCLLLLIVSPSLYVSFYEKILRGFVDHGRFDLWRSGVEDFLTNGVFGVGFFNVDFSSWSGIGMPGFLHNTLVQLLASCGALGLVAYLVYRAGTITLFVRRPNGMRTFLALMLAALLGTSLLDNNIFNIYPSFYYAVILSLAEKDLERTLEAPCN